MGAVDGQIDPERLIAYLEKHAAEAPPQEPPLLVRYAMYQGLADRVRRGYFNYGCTEDPDLGRKEP